MRKNAVLSFSVLSGVLLLSSCAHSSASKESATASVSTKFSVALPADSAHSRLALSAPGLSDDTPVQVISNSSVTAPNLTLEIVSDSREEFEAFKKDLIVARNDDTIELTFHAGSRHACEDLEGSPMKGTCVHAATVSLPPSSNLRVMVGNSVLYGQMDLDDLLHALTRQGVGIWDDGAELDTLQTFLSDHHDGQFLKVAEASRILEGFAFDSGKIAAAKLLSGKIVDPENAAHVKGARGALDLTQSTIVSLLGHSERAPADTDANQTVQRASLPTFRSRSRSQGDKRAGRKNGRRTDCPRD